MKLPFSKLHGAGNDFIFIDIRSNNLNLDKNQITKLCHRRNGIGADGVVFFNTSDQYDFIMHYYNADGSLGSLCGNAARCAVAFAYSLGIEKESYNFKAIDGVHSGKILQHTNQNWTISIDMKDIDEDKVIRHGDNFFINTGSPHHIEFVTEVDNIDVISKGKAIRYSTQYQPAGTNVNFASFDKNNIKIRTYERGVENETLACGTGVTAVAVATAILKNKKQAAYKIKARGGDLMVSFTKEKSQFTKITLIGPVAFVYSGVIAV